MADTLSTTFCRPAVEARAMFSVASSSVTMEWRAARRASVVLSMTCSSSRNELPETRVDMTGTLRRRASSMTVLKPSACDGMRNRSEFLM